MLATLIQTHSYVHNIILISFGIGMVCMVNSTLADNIVLRYSNLTFLNLERARTGLRNVQSSNLIGMRQLNNNELIVYINTKLRYYLLCRHRTNFTWMLKRTQTKHKRKRNKKTFPIAPYLHQLKWLTQQKKSKYCV